MYRNVRDIFPNACRNNPVNTLSIIHSRKIMYVEGITLNRTHIRKLWDCPDKMLPHIITSVEKSLAREEGPLVYH